MGYAMCFDGCFGDATSELHFGTLKHSKYDHKWLLGVKEMCVSTRIIEASLQGIEAGRCVAEHATTAHPVALR
eukprot:6213539-Pleurochrysis_carterae.AAC.1